MATGVLTELLISDGNLDEAEQTAEEALAVARRNGDRHGAAHCHRDLGDIDLHRGRYTEAARQFGEAVPMLLDMGDLRCASFAIAEHGTALMGMDRQREAKDMFGRAWRIVTEVEDLAGMIYCLDGLAELSDGLIAIRLHGAAEAVRRTAQFWISPGLATDEHVAALRSSVPEKAFTEAWEQGMELDPAVLVARVLASQP